jgi:hypothetical protein
MHLNQTEKTLLTALLQGSTLKSHRYLDGVKLYHLHPLDSSPVQAVEPALVEQLKAKGLIDSNMKFPAATYLLTQAGAAVAVQLAPASHVPLTTRPPRAER